MYSCETNSMQEWQERTEFNGNETNNLMEDVGIAISQETFDDANLETIAESVIDEFSLNRKQTVAFRLIIENVLKRKRDEDTEQKIVYIGGPGGTGKSQVIKAVVDFHDRINLRVRLRLCAFTGTAAKHIGGNTITTLAGLRNSNISTLEKKWNGVNTVLLDEISMVGCRLLAKLSRNITCAKHNDPSVPFGGVDIFCFGDFTQFPPPACIRYTTILQLQQRYIGTIN
ncbi:uncharacterized protein [Clytia hemisphaerica]|uniref:uncharacterized protein n=1 Tax=Clytia hemisphaerica TaxID=252671 RepID=UPI0034D63550